MIGLVLGMQEGCGLGEVLGKIEGFLLTEIDGKVGGRLLARTLAGADPGVCARQVAR